MTVALPNERYKILILCVVGLVFSVGLSVILGMDEAILYRSDLYARWYAISMRLSEGRNLYDVQSGAEVIDFVWGGLVESPWPGNFYYPAHLVLFLGPLALLPYRAAHIIWTTAVQIFFYAAVWLGMGLARWPRTVNKKTLFVVLAALSLPNLHHTAWSQFNSIGVLGLVLCFWALRRERYLLAGLFAAGLTFKPHVTVLPLLFLVVWSISVRERRTFVLGLAASAGGLWLAAELFQPGWIRAFFEVMGNYSSVPSVLDQVWNPKQITAVLLCLVALVILLRNRKVPFASAPFVGTVSLTVAVWLLVVPIVGMLHVLLLIALVPLLLSSLKQHRPALFLPAALGFSVVYALGVFVFFWGLQYGKNHEWSAMVYGGLGSLSVALVSLPLCFIVRAEPPPSTS